MCVENNKHSQKACNYTSNAQKKTYDGTTKDKIKKENQLVRKSETGLTPWQCNETRDENKKYMKNKQEERGASE